MTKIENTDKLKIRINHKTYEEISIAEIMPETLFDEAIRDYEDEKNEIKKDVNEILKKQVSLNEQQLNKYNQKDDYYNEKIWTLQNLKSNFIKLKTNCITNYAYKKSLIGLGNDIFHIWVCDTTSLIKENERNYKMNDYGVKAYAQEIEDNQKWHLENWKDTTQDKILNIDKFLKYLQRTEPDEYNTVERVIDNDWFKLQEQIIELRSDLQKMLINFNQDEYYKNKMPSVAEKLDYWNYVGNNRWISLIDPHWRYRRTKVDDARIKYEEAKEDYDDAYLELHRKVA